MITTLCAVALLAVAVFVLALSPSSSAALTPRARARATSESASGTEVPRSHFETVWLPNQQFSYVIWLDSVADDPDYCKIEIGRAHV